MANPLLTFKLTIALARLVKNPSRLEVVFDLTDALLQDPEANATFEATLTIPEVARACRERRRLPVLDLATLDTAKPGTLARVAADFFRKNDLDPGALPRNEPKSDSEWLATHLYETHDLWHVVTGFQPNVAGELGLQAFYATQMSGLLPLAILSAGMVNTLFFAPDLGIERLAAITHGFRMGEAARQVGGGLVGRDWSQLLDRPIDEVRRTLGIQMNFEQATSPTALRATDRALEAA